ncbi:MULTISPECIES: DUF2513 domain-containing protein [unclassified Acetobacterium]|jgi:hypothetical protein|uniref:DUF2513 domain-containing protein n=1 Tax=unclassified Acetobacterium TaxID=2638182 RepID=UPI000DBEC5B7|nr:MULTISPECIES: DUF2513 domain-containing protein [unclassified Acetobacterium]AWW28349.1 hypothetical protein DOZ58_17850 [Acetobacterium sp. KB-1]MDZ5726704.1 DUF2513 domain-containing protein [Acetobacterium sp. K1/6]
MKLNHDCVRDLLLYIEDNLQHGSSLCAQNVILKPYENHDIIYTAVKLSEANFIEATKMNYISDLIPVIHIHSLTWDGHKFLDNIRDDRVWADTKEVTADFSSVSLRVIENVAVQIITALINRQICNNTDLNLK